MAAAYDNDGVAYDDGRQWQRPTTTAVVAYNKKGTLAYIDGRLRKQPRTVAAAAYIDGR